MDGQPKEMEIYKKIHLLLQDFYLLRRRIRVGYQVGTLGISEAQALVQAFAEPGLTAKRISEVLQLEKSSVSRLVAGLIKKGRLEAKPGAQDQREKLLFVTAAGAEFVGQLQTSNDRILRECLQNLSAKEQYDLAHCMKQLADGLGCSAATYLPGDHPLTLEIVRLGRGTGMTSACFMGTEYTSTQYHLLSSLAKAPGQNIHSIAGRIPLDTSTLLRAVQTLRQKDLLSSLSETNKGGGASFTLTAAGRALVMEIDTKAAALIRHGLEKGDAQSTRDLEALLEKVIVGSETPGVGVIQERIEVRALANLSERQTARGLLLDALVRSNRHFETGDQMFAPGNKSFGLFVSNQLVAACEAVQSNGRMEIENAAQIPQITAQTIEKFHDTVRQMSRVPKQE